MIQSIIVEVLGWLCKDLVRCIPWFCKYIVVSRCKRLPAEYREKVTSFLIADIDNEESMIRKLIIALGSLEQEWHDYPDIDNIEKSQDKLRDESHEDE